MKYSVITFYPINNSTWLKITKDIIYNLSTLKDLAIFWWGCKQRSTACPALRGRVFFAVQVQVLCVLRVSWYRILMGPGNYQGTQKLNSGQWCGRGISHYKSVRRAVTNYKKWEKQMNFIFRVWWS